MKRKFVLRNILCLLLVFLVGLGNITGVGAAEASVSTDASDVALKVNDKPKAEIALAVGQTKVNYSTFREDLTAILLEKGIAAEDISFVEVDANASSTTESFNWWRYDHSVNSSIIKTDDVKHIYIENTNAAYSQSSNDYNSLNYHIYTSNNGATMDFYGYGSSAYKDFNFLPNEQATKKVIEFTIAEGEAYDALDGIGFLVNTSITGSYASKNQVINGYLVFFHYNSSGVGTTMSIFKLTNVNAYNLHQSTGNTFESYTGISGVTRVATCSVYGNYRYRKVKIEVMPDYIKVWYNGSGSDNSALELTDSHLMEWTYNGSAVDSVPLTPGYDTVNGEEVFRGGYGPLSSYRSHNCSRLTHLTLSNLSMEADYVRSLTEVVREPSWTEDKVSFLVNLNEASIDDFSDVYSTAEIINRLQDDSVAYIGWCSSKNHTDSQEFVTGVGNGSGLVNLNTVYDNSDPYSTASYQKQVEAIADIIYARLQKVTSGSDEYTFLTSEEFSFTAMGSGQLDDGNWSVGYSKTDYASAKNNISTYQNLANASFAQCGYYEIYYDGDTENPKAKIRIHELPLAIFSASMAPDTGISVTNKSYDPEFCTDIANATGSEADGIKESLFEYYNLTADSPAWTTLAPTTVADGDTWLVRLTVTDAEGVTASTVQQMSYSADAEEVPAPYGTFKLSSTQYIKGIDTYIVIIDQSYMLDGSKEFEVTYTITNSSGTTVWTSSTDATSSNYFAPGTTYQYALENLAEGTYTISMTASNASNTSEKVSRTFKVVQGYSVTYDDGEGSGAPETQYKIKGDTLTLSNIAPTRTGYTFAGWVDASGNIYQPGDAYATDANLELTAKWAYNMSYEATGYTGDYDAQAHGIKIEVIDSNNQDVTIKYGTVYGTYDLVEMPTYTDAGTYTIYFEITADGCQTVTNSRTVVINKVLPSVVLADKVVSYDGNAHTIDAPVITGVAEGDASTGEITYIYYIDAECTQLTTLENSGAAAEGAAPVWKGIYYVKATVAEDKNYLEGTSNVAILNIRKYTVHFDLNGLEGIDGTIPADIVDVIAGNTIEEPAVPKCETHIFIGWYKDEACEVPWDFETDIVTEDTTLYAKWRHKSTYEAYWYDEETDEYQYGTFEEALDENPKNIVIQNPITIDENTIIPEDMNIEVIPQNLEITISDGVEFVNNGNISGGKLNGDLINNGMIEDAIIDGNVDNANGTIKDVVIEEGSNVSGGDVTGNTINNGTIEDAAISGTVDNTNGTIEDATIEEGSTVSGGDIAGNTTNNGTIEDATISGTMDNTNGTIEDATIEEGSAVSGGDVTGNTTNNGTIEDATIDGTVDNTNGTIEDATIEEGGTVSGGDVTGNTTNNGTIENAAVSGNTINNGTIADSSLGGTVDNTNGIIEDAVVEEGSIVSGGDVTGNTTNNGTIEDAIISGSVDNTNGTIEDAVIEEGSTVSGGDVIGETTNNGTIEDATISGSVDNTNGTIEDAVIEEGSTVSGGDVTGNTTNNGTIEDATISGSVDNTNGTIEDATIAEGSTVSGGDVIGETTNNGTIEGATIEGTVDNTNGTIEGAVIEEGGTVSGGDVTGETVNNGTIEDATIDGTVDNTNGIIEDATIEEGSTVTGGDIAGNTTNNGTIEDATIGGTVDNTNGTIEDAVIEEGSTISGGDVTGETVNNGTIEDATIDGTVDNTNGTIEDATIGGTVDNTNGTIEDAVIEEGGTVSGGDVTGETTNNGTIEDATIDGTVDNTNGTIEDATIEEGSTVTGGDIAGNTTNNGTIEDATIEGTVDNTNGTIENATIEEGGTVSGGDVTGETTNNGTIEDATIEGTVDNTNGTIEDATIEEGSTVTGGDIAGNTTNNGTIEDATIGGTVDNTNGTIEDATIEEGGTVSGGDVTGETTNNGTIEDATIEGTVDNTNGTIEDAVIEEGGTVSGGDVTGETTNNGTIEDATIDGTVDNTNGTIEDAVINEGSTVSGGTISGETVNNGAIESSMIVGSLENNGSVEDAKVSGTVTGNGEIENDQEYVQEQIDKVEEELKDTTVTDNSTVSFGEGEIEVEVVIKENEDEDGEIIISGLIVSSRNDVIDAVLSNDEKLNVINGKDVSIEFVIAPMLNAEENADVTQMIQHLMSKNEDIILGTVLDLFVQMKFGETDWTRISELSNEIEIVIDVPEELRFNGATYYIVRNHNGECVVLEDLDNDPNTITFRTDRFSTYAIAYDRNNVCTLCGVCPNFLGMCIIIWIAIAIVITVIVVFLGKKRKQQNERQEIKL